MPSQGQGGELRNQAAAAQPSAPEAPSAGGASIPMGPDSSPRLAVSGQRPPCSEASFPSSARWTTAGGSIGVPALLSPPLCPFA